MLAIIQCVVLLKKKMEQKVKGSPEQKRGRHIRQIKTDVMRMKTTTKTTPLHLIHQKKKLPP